MSARLRESMHVELFGLPGVGKSTVAAAMGVARGAGFAQSPQVEAGPARMVIVALSRPRLVARAIWTSLAVVIGVRGPLRARTRRAARMLRRLVTMSLPLDGGPAVYEEGPLNWVLANRWRSERLLIWVAGRLAHLYIDLGTVVVLLDAPEETILRRRRARKLGRATHDRDCRRSGLRRRRRRTVVGWETRSERLELLVSELRDARLRVIRLGVERFRSPDHLAEAILGHPALREN